MFQAEISARAYLEGLLDLKWLVIVYKDKACRLEKLKSERLVWTCLT